MTSVIIGIDLAKTVFQIHKMDEKGKVISHHKLRRSEVRPFLEKQDKANCLIAPKGIEKIETLQKLAEENTVLPAMKIVLDLLMRKIKKLSADIAGLDQQIKAEAKKDQRCTLLTEIPGIGFITASLLAASVPDMSVFPTARHFAAWLGLVPRLNSSGGKTKLGRISKSGNQQLRCCLVLGATSLLRLAGGKVPPPQLAWATKLIL